MSFVAVFCLYCQIALIPLNFCFPAPVPVFFASESMKKSVSAVSGWQFLHDSHGCIAMHVVKIYRVRSRQFFGWFVAIFT
ncbi:hypothetical protein MWL27_26405, partial [Escherichia coli]|nr:hypothetical protein [Escherichia coli]